MDFKAKVNRYKKMVATSMPINPKHGETEWSVSGQGYYRDYRGIITKVDDEMPDDYLERKFQDREKAARSLT